MQPLRICKSFCASSVSMRIYSISSPNLAIWFWTGKFIDASMFFFITVTDISIEFVYYYISPNKIRAFSVLKEL